MEDEKEYMSIAEECDIIMNRWRQKQIDKGRPDPFQPIIDLRKEHSVCIVCMRKLNKNTWQEDGMCCSCHPGKTDEN